VRDSPDRSGASCGSGASCSSAGQRGCTNHDRACVNAGCGFDLPILRSSNHAGVKLPT